MFSWDSGIPNTHHGHESPERHNWAPGHQSTRKDPRLEARSASFDPSTQQFDLFQDVIDDPYPAFRALRQRDPVHKGVRGFYYLSRYQDVRRALADHERLGRRGFLPLYRQNMGDGPLFHMTRQEFFLLDPPEHTRIRNATRPYFNHERIGALGGRIQQIVDDLLDDVQRVGGYEWDLIKGLASPLPFIVVCDVLGIPPVDRNSIRAWTLDILPAMDPQLTPELLSQGNRATADFDSYLDVLIAQRRREPQDDLVSALLHQQRKDPSAISNDEIRALCIIMIIAGYETPWGLIGNVMLALLRHLDQMTLLVDEPALVDAVVQEGLRYDSPSQWAPRVAYKDLTTPSGATIPAGAFVAVLLASANRDETIFADADRFNVRRYANSGTAPRPVSFGLGARYCLGAGLARLEAQVALCTLLRRMPSLRLACEPSQLQWRPGSFVRNLVSLLVVVQ